MTEEARNKRNEYHRRWYAANKDKVKQYVRNYWERKVKREAFTDGSQDTDPEQPGITS